LGVGADEPLKPLTNAAAQPPPATAPALTSEYQHLLVLKMTEEVRERVISWLKWLGGIFLAIGVIVGIPAYRSWHEAIKAIDTKVDRVIETAVDRRFGEYKKFTEHMIETLVNFQATQQTAAQDLSTNIDTFKQKLQELEKRAKEFHGELDTSREQARRSLTEFEESLALRLSPAEQETAEASQEEVFIKRSRAYAVRLGLGEPRPEIEVINMKEPGIYTMWNDKTGKQEVNRPHLGVPGLAEYAAVMSHFLAKHYRKMGKGDFEFWNDFRHSVTGYIISTEPENVGKVGVVGGPDYVRSNPTFQALERLEKELGDTKPVRQLALELLKTYEVDWSWRNLQSKALGANDRLKLMPDEMIRKAFKKKS
jgi:hypothetical protein